MPLDLVVLGANSAHPLIDRFSSSFVLNSDKRSFLIDAGEGCQIKMGQFKVKRSKISHVFISHMHGDHVFGLPGLITSFSLNNRTSPLSVWGPVGIKRYLNTILEISEARLSFDLSINEIEQDVFQKILDFDDIEIHAFPLQHRIKTFGYLFKEKLGSRNIIPEKIEEYSMSVKEIKAAKAGKDLKREDKYISNELITFVKERLKSFAYCSDTIYDESLASILQGVDLLYHEATYTNDLKEQASERMHTTAEQAGMIAKKSAAKKLLIGHFSSRYADLNPLLEEAQSVFANSHLAEEGKIIHI